MSLAHLPHSYSPEVKAALQAHQPIVALESTIITHGLPYPDNVAVALEVERLVRKGGAVPATIAIMEGVIHIGLMAEQIEQLAKQSKVRKLSSRDIGGALADGAYGSTTVAATMCLAHHAGIPVFVTGGIGGVHQEASDTFDVSADLIELSKTPVAVVCAGAKSILDIGLTLEYLETHAVPVWGHQTHQFPAFYTQDSGFSVDQSFNSESRLALALKYHWALNQTGVVIANPIPSDAALDSGWISEMIQLALQEAKHLGIKGKAVTPFLLKRLQGTTEGKALDANKALIFHNATVGASIAVELAKQRGD